MASHVDKVILLFIIFFERFIITLLFIKLFITLFITLLFIIFFGRFIITLLFITLFITLLFIIFFERFIITLFITLLHYYIIYYIFRKIYYITILLFIILFERFITFLHYYIIISFERFSKDYYTIRKIYSIITLLFIILFERYEGIYSRHVFSTSRERNTVKKREDLLSHCWKENWRHEFSAYIIRNWWRHASSVFRTKIYTEVYTVFLALQPPRMINLLHENPRVRLRDSFDISEENQRVVVMVVLVSRYSGHV